jgi:Icc-related predicted phosphoesterase
VSATDPTPAGRSRVRRWLVRLAALLGLAVACTAGGVAATTLFPTSVGTLNYGATLRLSIAPTDASSIQSPTIFGDIRMRFAGPVPAPGVLAQVQVKERITELLSRPGVSVRDLEPGPLELEKAARDAAIAMGLRFAAGALVVGLVALLGYAVWRRGDPARLRWGRAVGLVAGAWLVAGAATFGSIAVTYHPEQLESFKTTGILGTVQRNADLLAGVEERAEQTTPYLKNLLALSAALQEKYAPQALGKPVAARILFVSDVHGANQYPLMKTIIEQEDVDAVVDSGDLVNFGTASEGEAAGVFSGIRSLGVPYLFVRGNHDATSDVDQALLDRLAKVPNVVLLQPNASTYQIESIAGLRIAGFNDPRWFGDDNRNNAAKQKPAAAAFVRALGDRPSPDVLVSHEPAAVEDVDQPGGIRVNGHLHKAELEGNRVGVGTFTGGGPFSHFVAQGEDGAELTGQPSSFDIAAFGEDCRLASLTRYQFRNVIEGRPAYDDVTLVNGARIEAELPETTVAGDKLKAPAQPRTCSATAPRSTERVTAPTG